MRHMRARNGPPSQHAWVLHDPNALGHTNTFESWVHLLDNMQGTQYIFSMYT